MSTIVQRVEPWEARQGGHHKLLEGVVDESFRKMIDSLRPSFCRLMEMEPHAGTPPPTDMPVSGVYLFSDGDKPLYVGRSNRMRKRYFLHVGGKHNQASFAYRLVAETLKLPPAAYTKENSRKVVASTEDFIREFASAKGRIRAMNYRYVEEKDQTRQALLEIYVAVVLQTPYNDFGTH